MSEIYDFNEDSYNNLANQEANNERNNVIQFFETDVYQEYLLKFHKITYRMCNK